MRIFNNIIIKKKNQDLLININRDFDNLIYINENKLKNETYLIYKNNILNFYFITS